MPAVVLDADEPTSYQLAILGGLQDKPQYGGTVSYVERLRRRARNRVARRSRQINR